MEGADVKNYIRPYYRTGAAQGQGAAVLPLQKGGTTVTPSGTTKITKGSSKVQGKEEQVYVLIPPKPF